VRRRAAALASAAALIHRMLDHVRQYIYIYISHATEERRASSCHCFQFLSFEVKTKNFLLWTARSFVFSSFFFSVCLLSSLVFAPFGP